MTPFFQKWQHLMNIIKHCETPIDVQLQGNSSTLYQVSVHFLQEETVRGAALVLPCLHSRSQLLLLLAAAAAADDDDDDAAMPSRSSTQPSGVFWLADAQ